ncbi:hypothetical protein HHK36_001845 [Tetracentron sinense]|uniref:SBP-type domain-containing protein n=1 Tax=Tetracentron sinense TaxID=13715 RepID=A0A835DRZ4_TETSI|nr:hypothetical protein HHK36_001845 [Tetracentron sinense]
METRRAEGKRIMTQNVKKEAMVVVEEDGEEDDDEILGLGFEEDEKKKSRKGPAGGGVSPPCCQAEKCGSDLTDAKRYHRRHKVCELHAGASVVLVAGLRQRFCQQCSRFHELSEFDEAKKSCRRRLAGHNERRRKNSSESPGEGSSHKGVCLCRWMSPHLKENLCKQADENRRIQITLPGNSTYKHFQIR